MNDLPEFNPVPLPLHAPGFSIALHPLTIDHAADLRTAGDDDELWTYLLTQRPLSLEDYCRYIETALSSQRAGSELPFAIIDHATHRSIGTTRYMEILRPHRSLEIGHTWLSAAYRRTRVNTECKYLLLCHAFETLGAMRVQLKTDSRNLRSQTAIERIGAKFEGRLRKHRICHDGYIRDTMMYSIIREEWPEVRDRLLMHLNR